MKENPYSSPNSAAIPPVNYGEPLIATQLASHGTRFLNAFIDGIIIRIMAFGIGFALGTVFVVSQMSSTGELSAESEAMLNLIGLVLGLIILLAYYIITETLFQRSLAKFITGTKVVSENGDNPTFGQIVGRSFARLIPFEPFSFLTSKPVGWHDSLSKTRVITTR